MPHSDTEVISVFFFLNYELTVLFSELELYETNFLNIVECIENCKVQNKTEIFVEMWTD